MDRQVRPRDPKSHATRAAVESPVVAAHAAKAWVRFPIRFVTRSSVRSGEYVATGLRLLLLGRLAELGTDLGEVPVDRPAGAAADELDVAVGLVVAALRPEVVET